MGLYGRRFGTPEFEVMVAGGRVSRIVVLRGAPCGSTWEVAARLAGLKKKEALERIGLEVQFYCTADPAGWDPMGGRSPVHIAGEVHRAALKKALS